MGRRHVALLVEDDVGLAQDLGEILESLGHDHIHVTNKADAERLIGSEEFCYVLLDLQILANTDLIKPRVEAGQSLLEVIRDRFPYTDNFGKHKLQVLIMSGHAKEHDYVVDAFQKGADDFIKKPFGTAQASLKEKIQSALGRSGREKHERCIEITNAARGTPSATTNNALPIKIAIVGRQEEKRFEIRIGEKAVAMTPGSFLLLLKLYRARLRPGAGWAHKNHDLGVTNDQGWKGMTRFREEFAPHLPKKTPVVENDNRGSFRLHSTNVEITDIDTGMLETIEGEGFEPVVAEIKQLLADNNRRHKSPHRRQ